MTVIEVQNSYINELDFHIPVLAEMKHYLISIK